MEEAFNSTNWQADLTLEFAPRAGKTRKVTSKRLGPLTVQRAFSQKVMSTIPTCYTPLVAWLEVTN